MSNKHFIIPIFVPHEGCPHDCVFCNQNSITGSSHVVDAEFVRNTIEQYISTINKKKSDSSIIEISFFGGTFTAIDLEKQSRLLKIAYEYKNSGKINYIRLSTRPDYIDEKILENLKKYSVDIIELGVQSLDEEVLIKSGRGHSAQDVYKASELIKSYGFTLGHQIMLGLPGDDFDKDIDTAKKVVSLKPSICRIYPALVVKNTPMAKMLSNGEYRPYTLDEAVEIAKRVYGILKINNINIIRIGLQPTEEINESAEVIEGPFHPAFRELVEGSIFNDLIIDELKGRDIKKLTIQVNNKDISKLYANKKKFFNDMKVQIKALNIKVIQDSTLNRNEIHINADDYCKNMSIDVYMKKKYIEGN